MDEIATNPGPANPSNPGPSDPGTYLIFEFGGVFAALDIDRVREVVDPAPVTPVPRMPAYLLGAMNLRGHVLTVLDLGIKMGIGPARPGADACVVVVEASAGGEAVRLGIPVDRVLRVVSLPPEAIAPPPRLGLGIRPEMVRGVADLDGVFPLVLDLDRALADPAVGPGMDAVPAPEPDREGKEPLLDLDRS